MFKAKENTRTKVMPARLISLIITVLIAVLLASACNQQGPRLPATYTYNPGPVFVTNINSEDSRRVVKCAVVFEVIDNAAVEELNAHNFAIRNAVLVVLGELTLEEVTTNKDLSVVSQRLVDEVNKTVSSQVDMFTGAYFTEFVLA